MTRSLPLSLTAILLLCGCKTAPQPVAAVSAETTPRDPSRITATGPIVQRLKLAQPEWASVGASLTVASRVEVDGTRVTRVGSPVMGRINSLAVHEGEQVHRGQLLALLTSTGLSDGQLQLLKSLSQRQVAQRAVERAQLLLKADVIGSAELQRREAELAQATAELAAARDQLMLLGMPDDAVKELERSRTMNSVSRIVASMDGTVLDRKVTLGQVVQPADTVFEIADLSNLWLVADVPEASAGYVAAGQLVEAEIGAFPGQIIRGKLPFVSSTVNPETRTVRVRMDLVNPKARFKPAMLAIMTLKEHPERKLVIPVSAVVREGDQEYVMVHLKERDYQLRKVTLGPEYNGGRVVTEGIQPDEKILSEGAFHLNNERRRQMAGNDGDSSC